jgi:nucleotide-binding universal stress UspA family protein
VVIEVFMSVTEDQIVLIVDQILLATDFSSASEVATNYACAVAKRFSSTVTLANVVDLSIAARSEAAVVGKPIDEMRQTSSENLERLLSNLLCAGIQAKAQTLQSRDPAASIVALAEEQNSDLIIVGTHARHGLNKLILGSCAEGVIRHARCPVLTIGPNVKEEPDATFLFSSILFATDLDPDAARKAGLALAFAKDCVGKISLCHILEHPGKTISDTLDQQSKFEVALQKLVPGSSYDWCYSDYIVEIGEVAIRILETAKTVKAKLIVLGAKMNSPLSARLGGGVVGSVLAKAECPVMTIGSV